MEGGGCRGGFWITVDKSTVPVVEGSLCLVPVVY